MRKVLIAIFLMFCVLTAAAQDQLVRRNGEIIRCKVVQVGTEEITYTQPELNTNVEFVIEKSKVEKIVFENGSEYIVDHAGMADESVETNSADLFLVQNRNDIKFNFFSILFGTTAMGYERAVRAGQSVNLDIGLIGIGKDINEEDPAGIGFKAGYKFIRSPDFYLRKLRYAHILKGSYVMPEIAFASYQIRSEDEHNTKVSFFLTCGKQNVLSDLFLIDWFFSVGYGFAFGDQDHYPYYFGVLDNEFPLSGSVGLRIGFLF